MNKKARYRFFGKKQFFIIWLVLVIEIAVILCINIMNDTEKKINLLNYQNNIGGYVSYFAKDIDQEKIDFIAQQESVENLGVVTYYKQLSDSERQQIWMRGANDNYILRNSMIGKGRLPENRNEVIAEEWVFHNLGIEATPGVTFQLDLVDKDKNPSSETFTVAGVLVDNHSNQTSRVLNLFLPFNLQEDSDAFVYVDYKQGVDIGDETVQIISSLTDGLPLEELDERDYKFDYEIDTMTSNLYQIKSKDIAVSIAIAICAGIFLIGMFLMSLERQLKEIGILRACGYSMKKIQSTLFCELSFLFLSAIPIGFLLSIGLTSVIQMATGIHNIQYLFLGEHVSISNSYPWQLMIIGVFATGVIVFLEFLYIIYSARKYSIVGLVKGANKLQDGKKHSFSLANYSASPMIGTDHKQGNGTKKQRATIRSKISLPTALAVQRMTSKKGISLLIILSLCCSGTMFLVLDYKISAKQKVAEEEYFQRCQNADMTLIEYLDNTILTGITEEELADIKAVEGVRAVESTLVLPIRLLLEEQHTMSKLYFDSFNGYAKANDVFFKEYAGKEKGSDDYVFKSSLFGYNQEAMEQLKPYVVAGEIDYDAMKNSNQAVVFVPHFQEDSINGNYIRNGKGQQVVDYQVGDVLSMKYRSDYIVEDNGFWQLEDINGEYAEETVTIGAIVSYPYLENTSKTSYSNPNVIISEEWMKQITQVDVYSTVNVQLEATVYGEQVEGTIQEIMSDNHGIVISNLMESKLEREENLNKEQMFSILWTMLVFVGMLSCVIGCIRYNTHSRKKDYAVYRALGMSIKGIRKSVRIEGFIYGISASVIVLIISYSIQKYLFQNTGLAYVGGSFWLHEWNKVVAILFNLIIAIGISDREILKMEKQSIVSMLNREE